MKQLSKSRVVWNISLVLILIIEVIAMLAWAMDWPIKKYAMIPNAILGALIVGFICHWDWRQMKRREAEGERFWLFQAILVLILIALAVTVTWIILSGGAPWS